MNRNKKIDRLDFLIICLITIAYTIVSLINLGDTATPTTQPKMENGQYISYITLEEQEHVDKVLLFKGMGVFNVAVYNSADNGTTWHEIASGMYGSDPGEIYKWITIDVDCVTQNLCISIGADADLELFEAGIISNDREVLKTYTSNECRLFDEQQFVPVNPTYMNETYFDEIYYVRTAHEHLDGKYPFECSHPPLGKLIIALGTIVFGMNPFGWRIMGNLFGIAMIALMYVFAKRLFKNTFFATAATFFLAFDFMHFTQTRLATIDSFSIFFIMLMYYLMYIYYDSSVEQLPRKDALKILALCGVAFGLGISTKWLCVYAGIGLAVLFTIALVKRTKQGDDPIRTCLWCVLFFIVIPFCIYFVSYIPYFIAVPDQSIFKTFWDNQVYMLTYHSGLEATHPFESSWYAWPLMLRPMWYYGNEAIANYGLCSTIVALGNPIIWWGGTLCMLFLLFKPKKRSGEWFVVIGFLSQFLPWVLISRSTFIYHYFASVPFIVLALVYVLKMISDKYKKGRIVTIVVLAIAFVLFCMFYPVISGSVTSRSYVMNVLKWFESWILCY
ncbi:MAG: phospholipid carrier-dependent glycosyltransferase [Ruminococcaceae bacterium]|nr:phospholipid carrier-dependent glycosyltransferase [Oscillospiraceae bacterium]